MPRAPLALALLLLAASAAEAQRFSIETFDVSLPLRVGGFRRGGLEIAEDAYLARYRDAAGREVDAYFHAYRVEDECGAGCDSVAVDAGADAFLSSIPALVERRAFDRLAVVLDERVARPAGGWRGRHLALRGTRGGADVTSRLYVLSEGTYLMRLRATYAPDAAADAEIDAFAGEIVRAIRELNAGCPAGAYDGDGVVVGEDVTGEPTAVAERAAAFLTEAGYTVLPRSSPTPSSPRRDGRRRPRWTPRATAGTPGRGSRW
jgi:hypothetical protein